MLHFYIIVISQPDNVTTVCEGEQKVFSCVLNTTDFNINNSDVQWYRFIQDTSTTEMVDPQDSNIHFTTSTTSNTLNSSLTITTTRKYYNGYYWVGTPSLNVCNVSLTVTASM